MTMRCYIPVIGILGFIFGCCITVIIAIICLPSNHYWPSVYEDRSHYLHDVVFNNNFTYRSALFLYQNSFSSTNKTYKTEEQYLTLKANMLCYSIERETDDEDHARMIISTWARHCDKFVMFYTSRSLLDKLKPQYLNSEQTRLIYVDSRNSTIGTLLRTLQLYIPEYHWFTYVPAKVFLIPNNLKYFLLATKMDHKRVAFLGKPDIGRLFATWQISEESPLAISSRAILTALKTDSTSCFQDDIEGERVRLCN